MSNQNRNNFLNTLRDYLRENNPEETNNVNVIPNPSSLLFMSFLDTRSISLSDYTLRIRLNTERRETQNISPHMPRQNNERTNEDISRINQPQNDRNTLSGLNDLMSGEQQEEQNQNTNPVIPIFRHFRVRNEHEGEHIRLPYVIVFDIVRNNTTISIEFHSDEITIMDNLAWLGEYNMNFPNTSFRNVCNLQRLKKLKVRRITKKETKEDCSICLNSFKYRELARTLPCEHVFHKKCVDKWLLNQSEACPICRKVVEK
jgi:Ring finger domain